MAPNCSLGAALHKTLISGTILTLCPLILPSTRLEIGPLLWRAASRSAGYGSRVSLPGL